MKYLISLIPFYGMYYFCQKADELEYFPFFVFFWAVIHAVFTVNPIVLLFNLIF